MLCILNYLIVESVNVAHLVARMTGTPRETLPADTMRVTVPLARDAMHSESRQEYNELDYDQEECDPADLIQLGDVNSINACSSKSESEVCIPVPVRVQQQAANMTCMDTADGDLELKFASAQQAQKSAKDDLRTSVQQGEMEVKYIHGMYKQSMPATKKLASALVEGMISGGGQDQTCVKIL